VLLNFYFDENGGGGGPVVDCVKSQTKQLVSVVENIEYAS